MIAKPTPLEMALEVRDKIGKVLREQRPTFKIDFGDDKPRHAEIQFLITDANDAVVATTAGKYWLPLTVIDKSPSELWQWLQQFAVSGRL
jgi:hypothetical protein